MINKIKYDNINLLNKKLDLIERKIKAKMIYKVMEYEPEVKEEVRGKSRQESYGK